jgi:hypothetical protein
MIEPVHQWRALVVDQVNEKDLFNRVGTDDDLPLQTVSVPKETDRSKVAVLSWRWDGKYRIWGSRNVASAVVQAKRSGFQYLFIDAISIDQTLQGDELVHEIISFSKLYTTIPVIAAWGGDGGDIRKTMRRPWIMSEAKLISRNRARLIVSLFKVVRSPLRSSQVAVTPNH